MYNAPLDEYRIIINAGSEQGVNDDNCFEIHGVIDNVYDPETQELLGTLNGIKATVYPIEIHEKMSICKNIKTVKSPMFSEVAQLLALLNTSTSLKLNVDKSQISNPELFEPIQLGDKAILQTIDEPSDSEQQDTEAKKSKICLPDNQDKE